MKAAFRSEDVHAGPAPASLSNHGVGMMGRTANLGEGGEGLSRNLESADRGSASLGGVLGIVKSRTQALTCNEETLDLGRFQPALVHVNAQRPLQKFRERGFQAVHVQLKPEDISLVPKT